MSLNSIKSKLVLIVGIFLISLQVAADNIDEDFTEPREDFKITLTTSDTIPTPKHVYELRSYKGLIEDTLSTMNQAEKKQFIEQIRTQIISFGYILDVEDGMLFVHKLLETLSQKDSKHPIIYKCSHRYTRQNIYIASETDTTFLLNYFNTHNPDTNTSEYDQALFQLATQMTRKHHDQKIKNTNDYESRGPQYIEAFMTAHKSFKEQGFFYSDEKREILTPIVDTVQYTISKELFGEHISQKYKDQKIIIHLINLKDFGGITYDTSIFVNQQIPASMTATTPSVIYVLSQNAVYGNETWHYIFQKEYQPKLEKYFKKCKNQQEAYQAFLALFPQEYQELMIKFLGTKEMLNAKGYSLTLESYTNILITVINETGSDRISILTDPKDIHRILMNTGVQEYGSNVNLGYLLTQFVAKQSLVYITDPNNGDQNLSILIQPNTTADFLKFTKMITKVLEGL